MEEKAEYYFSEVKKIGGVIPAIEMGYFQKEIAEASEKYQKSIESKERIVVGVNKFQKENENIEIPILEIGSETEKYQRKSLNELRKKRNSNIVKSSLQTLRNSCKNDTNLMPCIIECAKNYATLGEIIYSMKEVFGEWQENATI